MTMRRLLGTVLLAPVLLLTAACGGGDDAADPVASDPATSSTSPAGTEEPDDGALDYDAQLVSGTAAGGQASELLVPIGTDAELDAFLEQFRNPTFPDDVRAAVEAAGDGEVYAGIVALGCDIPPSVEVTEGEAGYVARAGKVADPLPECLAPVTTVAVVTIAG